MTKYSGVVEVGLVLMVGMWFNHNRNYKVDRSNHNLNPTQQHNKTTTPWLWLWLWL